MSGERRPSAGDSPVMSVNTTFEYLIFYKLVVWFIHLFIGVNKFYMQNYSFKII